MNYRVLLTWNGVSTTRFLCEHHRTEAQQDTESVQLQVLGETDQLCEDCIQNVTEKLVPPNPHGFSTEDIRVLKEMRIYARVSSHIRMLDRLLGRTNEKKDLQPSHPRSCQGDGVRPSGEVEDSRL